MALYSKEIFRMMKFKEMEFLFGQIKNLMMGPGIKIKCMAKAYFIGLMAENMKDNL